MTCHGYRGKCGIGHIQSEGPQKTSRFGHSGMESITRTYVTQSLMTMGKILEKVKSMTPQYGLLF